MNGNLQYGDTARFLTAHITNFHLTKRYVFNKKGINQFVPKGVKRGSRRDLEDRLAMSIENVRELRAEMRQDKENILYLRESIRAERALQEDLKLKMRKLSE